MKKNNNTFSKIIKPKSNWWEIDFKELWDYRELFIIFAWRDIKVRYKQTLLGVAWVVFQPLVTSLIFTVFFGNLAKIPSGKLPYPLFVLTGLVFWTYFSNVLSHASQSLIENENIIKKVYLPKIIIPISAVFTGLVDFAINLVILIFSSIFIFKKIPAPSFLFIVPLGVLISSIAASGIGLFLAALNVKYRDVRYILPFFIQLMLFLTPVIYPSSILRPSNKFILALNPMSGVIESVRAVISKTPLDMFALGVSFVASIGFLIIGLYYFRSTERFLSDLI